MSTDDVLELMCAVRDALRTPRGARLAREIGALYVQADMGSGDTEDTYAARVVAKALARAQRVASGRRRPTRHGNGAR